MDPTRGYVTKESREGTPREFRVVTLKEGAITQKTETENTGATSNRLYSSDIGMIVTDFLDKHFSDVMSYNFTAGMEEKFDDIAEGQAEWKEMLKGFYGPFHKDVEETIETAERAKGTRVLGTDPETGHLSLIHI